MSRDSFYHESTGVYTVNGMECGQSLAHYGKKGMRWGVRRYQNPDGTLTAAGRVHYGYGEARRPTIGQRLGQAVNRAKKNRQIKAVEKAQRKGKTNKRTIRNLSDDELAKITERLKKENMLLSELEKKQRSIHNMQELKKNRTTLFSKYGMQIVSQLITGHNQANTAVKQAETQGKNRLKEIALRDKLGLNAAENYKTGEKPKKKDENKDEKKDDDPEKKKKKKENNRTVITKE